MATADLSARADRVAQIATSLAACAFARNAVHS
jgi:hypothetical protein